MIHELFSKTVFAFVGQRQPLLDQGEFAKRGVFCALASIGVFPCNHYNTTMIVLGMTGIVFSSVRPGNKDSAFI